MSDALSVALVGIGKIATDQHVPAIAASPDWQLAATVGFVPDPQEYQIAGKPKDKPTA